MIKITPMVLCLPFLAICQSGKLATELAPAMFLSTLAETETLLSIQAHQKDVLKHSKAISIKTAAIVSLKELELQKNRNSPSSLKQTTPWLQAVENLEYILQVNEDTYATASQIPDFDNTLLTFTLNLVSEAHLAFDDLKQITSEEDNNLITETDRFLLLQKANKPITKLLNTSIAINTLVHNLAKDKPLQPINYSISNAIQEAEHTINNLIIK